MCDTVDKAIGVLGTVSSQGGTVGEPLAALAEEHCKLISKLQEASAAAKSVQVLAELQQQIQDFDNSLSRGAGPTFLDRL